MILDFLPRKLVEEFRDFGMGLSRILHRPHFAHMGLEILDDILE